MIPGHAKNRRCAFCLILTTVMFLGLVQWSFVPLLADNGMPARNTILSMAEGHPSKFVAPFRCLFADSLTSCLPASGVSVPMVTATFFHRFEERASSREARFFSHPQLRAPPSV
jgi:hypothetical protein